MLLGLENQYGIILLAAGVSNRFGSSKQLLIFEGISLVKKMAQVAVKASDKVIVVTGANGESVEAELKALPVNIVQNKFFEEGIASSIRIGLETLLKEFKDIESVIFIVCDQPFISPQLLRALIEKKVQTNKGIISSEYAGTLGVPVLFQQKFFEELLTLRGDTGAKKIIYEHPDEVATIDFPLGKIDIDTIEDYKLLLQTQKTS